MNLIRKYHRWIYITILIGSITRYALIEPNAIIVVLIISGVLSFLPRLENSMDRVYCGQLMANHKERKWDYAAMILMIIMFIGSFIKII